MFGIEYLTKTLSNVKAGLSRKEMALRNLDSLLASDGFDQAAYFQKRNGFMLEIKALDQKLKDTQKDLNELRQRKSEETEFAKPGIRSRSVQNPDLQNHQLTFR